MSPRFGEDRTLLLLSADPDGTLVASVRFYFRPFFRTLFGQCWDIFGIIFGYFLMDEVITWKVIASLVVILIGIYIFKTNNKG